MNHSTERTLAARATALGNGADGGAFVELAEYLRSESPLVRRLAASALGKLSGLVPADGAVQALVPLLSDTHPQVRQYVAKALGSFGAHAAPALPDLRDLYRNPSELDYVKRSVLAAGRTIRAAMDLAAAKAVHRCLRCGVEVSADEFARSRMAFQRVFCDHCFDEVFLDRRNFETKVELQQLYQQQGKRLISLHWREKGRLEMDLELKMKEIRQ